MRNLKDLLGLLGNSQLLRKDIALHGVIKSILEWTGDFQSNTDASVTSIEKIVSGGGGGSSTGTVNATYLTSSPQTATLPFSRELLPGTNISFDDTVSGQRTISSAGADAADYVVASDGAIPTPSPINDGFGHFMYIPYTP